jgi:hypothetical protein
MDRPAFNRAMTGVLDSVGATIAPGLGESADSVEGGGSMGAPPSRVVAVPELLQQELANQYTVGLCLTGVARRVEDPSVYPRKRRRMIVALWPPKPNELDAAILTWAWRGWLGM